MKSVDSTVRRETLERDNHQCQLDAIFGISHLTGVPCVEEMEVHHKTYERYGNDVTSDLISVCRRCHDFLTNYIRGLRFGAKSQSYWKPEVNQATGVDTKQESRNGRDQVFTDRNSTIVDAQCTTGRPTRSGVESPSRYNRETKEG